MALVDPPIAISTRSAFSIDLPVACRRAQDGHRPRFV
jgi:hypothetical protein